MPAACTAVADVGTERSRIAFESAAHGDDVQNTAHTFGVIIWGRDWLSLQYA